MGNVVPMKGDNDASNGLTPRIQASIHWPPTADSGQTPEPTEKDMIDIQNFIDTLAEVALSVARREKSNQ